MTSAWRSENPGAWTASSVKRLRYSSVLTAWREKTVSTWARHGNLSFKLIKQKDKVSHHDLRDGLLLGLIPLRPLLTLSPSGVSFSGPPPALKWVPHNSSNNVPQQELPSHDSSPYPTKWHFRELMSETCLLPHVLYWPALGCPYPSILTGWASHIIFTLLPICRVAMC